MKTPILFTLALSLLLAAPAPSRAGDARVVKPLPPEDVALPPSLPAVPSPALRPGTDAPAPLPTAEEKPKTPAADADMTALLKKAGWKPIANDGLVSVDGPAKGYVPGNYLERAQFAWKNGKLIYRGAGPVEEAKLPGILKGLWAFVSAAQTTPEEAGKLIAAWGIQPSIDGRKILEPDGKATYYGVMLRWIYAENPGALKRASLTRLSQALDRLYQAYSFGFQQASPDVALVILDETKKILFLPAQPGEDALSLKPYQDLGAQLDGMRTKIEADIVSARSSGNEGRLHESEQALATLDQLKRQHYTDVQIPAVPVPGQKGSPYDFTNDKATTAPYAPLASGLPGLLRVLDRVYGPSLTLDQQENLIKSFPMGELVWRMGVQDLWREGLTGKGVKVAVIDGGIAPNAELDGSVDGKTNFTTGRGTSLNDDHGTHVAGIIHALAPDARINGYAVFTNNTDKMMQEDPDQAISAAIDRAVADGNRIISMSLGGSGSPSDAIARQVERYAAKGVIFVVAAGNERNQHAIGAPSVAPDAITVGSLNVTNRMADSSSYGVNFDAPNLSYVVKTVFMAPGTNILSTAPRSPFSAADDPPPAYQRMSGTSMATPALSAVSALLVQSAGNTNPLLLSQRLREALASSGQPISREGLPPNVPLEQPFLIVKPMAALEALRQASPSM